MATITILHGPQNINDNTQQVVVIHGETYNQAQVLAVAPGGAAAGWSVPPTWTTLEDGRRVTRANPRINLRNMKIWQLIRDL